MGRKKKKSEQIGQLLKIVKEYFRGRKSVPQTPQELQTRLSLTLDKIPILQQVLDILVEEGFLEKNEKVYQIQRDLKEIVTGILRVHPKGFGFLQVNASSPYLKDIFIPRHLTQHAVDGDLVEVKVNPEVVSEKGPEGKVISILKRSRSHIAGIITEIDHEGAYLAYAPLLGSRKKVIVEADQEEELAIGDRIVMAVTDWGTEYIPTTCHMHYLIGHISEPSCDVPAAIEEFGLRSDFSVQVLDEVNNFGKHVSPSEMNDREDLRNAECFTIDPTTAKDFDDAVSLSKDAHGYHLGVHIADVSHYVTPGSALDNEAMQRCNSTYFPSFCLPMLPSILSDNLCSLRPNVNRLTVSVFMDFDAQGKMTNYRFARSVIKSKKRFTYRQAKDVLDGKLKSPYLKTLSCMVELCLLLKKQRYNRGSIEFAMPELAIQVDEKGNPTGTDYIEYDITHQLVEEFMLKANEVVALHLSTHGKNLTYRVHEEPAEENIKEFADLARAFGFDLAKNPTPRDLQLLFDKAIETEIGPYLATGFIRRMRLATYSPNNIGHYGLALTHYCHFTSPIRRYVDLVVHRILFGEDDDLVRLEKIALICSEQERLSARAENSVTLLKKLRLLMEMNERDPQRLYQAVVTKVKNFGFYFEILELMLEGFIHISAVGDDYFIFEERSMTLRGSATKIAYYPGKQVEVKLFYIDLIMAETEWKLVSEEIVPQKRIPKKKIKKKKQFKKNKKNSRLAKGS